MPGFSRFYSSTLTHIGLFSKILFRSNTFTEDRKNKHMGKLEINILLYCMHRSSHVTPTAGILTCVSRLQPLQAQRWFAHKYTYQNNIPYLQFVLFLFFSPFSSLFSVLFNIIPLLFQGSGAAQSV